MGNPTGGKGVGQSSDHGLLADEVLKGHWPVLARQDGIGPADRRGGRRVLQGLCSGGIAENVDGQRIALRSEIGRSVRIIQVWIGHDAGLRGAGWRPTTTRSVTRCGCFLSDLTGLARRPPIADLHPLYRGWDGGVQARQVMPSV